MNKLTQILTVTGIGTVTALAIGAGPAQAASSTDSTGSAASKSSTAKTPAHFGWERTAGYYRSIGACEAAGNIGERFGRWDDHGCEFVRVGFHRGAWALEVSDRGWNGGFGHGFPGGGHGFPGGGHGFPGGNHGGGNHGGGNHGGGNHGGGNHGGGHHG